MSSDNQYTALGPAIIGFQTDATEIDVGADISGNRAGIQGHCASGPGVHGDSSDGTGVIGDGKIAGVSGAATAGVGVEGVGEYGVRGRATDGDGVQGFSESGRGGVFGSERRQEPGQLIAQVRLMAQQMDTGSRSKVTPEAFTRELINLPKDGRSGDLLLTASGTDGRCSLWLCVAELGGGQPSVWAQVLLGPEIAGGA